MHIKDQNSLVSILEAIDKIRQYSSEIQSADEFNDNPIVFDACLMNFIVIGEMVAKLSEDFREAHTHIDWHRIKGFRNIVAHEYFGIDAEEVWQVICEKLPVFREEILKLIS
jgi:uncharacterized protein with HEPN domain